MILVYKNTNESNDLHHGILITSNITENTVYVDVIPQGDLKTKRPDWKNLHIQSVYLTDIVGTQEDFAEYLV